MKRSTIVVAFTTVLATLVATTAAFAGGPNGKTLFRYVGQLQSTTDTSVTVAVQNGDRPALRSMLGQSQVQTFATGEKTVFLKWTHGIPEVVGIKDLAVNDYVTVNVRAHRGASLDTIKGTPAASVGDRGPTLNKPDKPLYLFRGTFVSTDGGKVVVDVKGGNRHALRLMIGQPAQQTFSTGGETVFLHWAHRIPTVIDAAHLKAGDRIVIRVRADRGATLTEVEATAARRVADREPKAQEANQSAQA
jgi:antitoxin component of MazEF toxin-antitoxin module